MKLHGHWMALIGVERACMQFNELEWRDQITGEKSSIFFAHDYSFTYTFLNVLENLRSSITYDRKCH